MVKRRLFVDLRDRFAACCPDLPLLRTLARTLTFECDTLAEVKMAADRTALVTGSVATPAPVLAFGFHLKSGAAFPPLVDFRGSICLVAQSKTTKPGRSLTTGTRIIIQPRSHKARIAFLRKRNRWMAACEFGIFRVVVEEVTTTLPGHVLAKPVNSCVRLFVSLAILYAVAAPTLLR